MSRMLCNGTHRFETPSMQFWRETNALLQAKKPGAPPLMFGEALALFATGSSVETAIEVVLAAMAVGEAGPIAHLAGEPAAPCA